ncbi:SH3 domain-containing protein [Dongia sp.]|uniref:SH3 domain-containing protein n=1 Tax=Dongia sp. TaxID=1977262 RepID=UPI0035B22440
MLTLALLAFANPALIRTGPIPGPPPLDLHPGIMFFGTALAQDKLPLPRFASLQSGEVNMRTGPGETYPILWTYQRAGLPVEIIEEFDIWRRIRDHDGVVGWVKSTLLVGKRHVLVRDSQRPLRESPEAGSRPVALVDPGVVLKVLECGGDWCRLEVQGHKGWMMKTEFWGVYATEAIED